MRSLWHRFQDVHRNLGMSSTLLLMPRWLLAREYAVFCLDLSQLQLPPVKESGLRWSSLCQRDMPLLSALNPAIDRAEIARRLANNQECMLGWLDRMLVHYRWDADQDTYLPFITRNIHLQAGDIVVCEAYTVSSARRRGIYWASAAHAARRAKEQGYRRYLTLLAIWNQPPLHVWRHKLGGRQVGTVSYWPTGLAKKYCLRGAVKLDSSGRLFVPYQA